MRAQPSRKVSAAIHQPKAYRRFNRTLFAIAVIAMSPFLNRRRPLNLDFELGPALPDRGSQIFDRMMPVDAFYCRDAPSSLATVQMSTPACVVGE